MVSILFATLVLLATALIGNYFIRGWSPGQGFILKMQTGTVKAGARRLEVKRGDYVLLGKKTFAEHCAVCHGDDARGMIGPDLTRRDFKYGKSKASLTETISNGRPGGMPAFGNRISREKVEWLAQYILSL